MRLSQAIDQNLWSSSITVTINETDNPESAKKAVKKLQAAAPNLIVSSHESVQVVCRSPALARFQLVQTTGIGPDINGSVNHSSLSTLFELQFPENENVLRLYGNGECD